MHLYIVQILTISCSWNTTLRKITVFFFLLNYQINSCINDDSSFAARVQIYVDSKPVLKNLMCKSFGQWHCFVVLFYSGLHENYTSKLSNCREWRHMFRKLRRRNFLGNYSLNWKYCGGYINFILCILMFIFC